MEGMAGQRCQCYCRDHRRRCTVAREEGLCSPVLVGRLDYHGSFGEHAFASESTRIQKVNAHFFDRQYNGAWEFSDGLF